MESDQVEWLKSCYREAPVEGPSAKRVKFSDVYQQLEKQFAPVQVTAKTASQMIKIAFPCSESKPCGRSRQKHIFGIQPVHISAESGAQLEVTRLLPQESGSNTSLLEIEQAKSQLLQEQVQTLESRVLELERIQAASLCPEALVQQLQQVIQPGLQVFDGPDSLEHFHNFSVDAVISELQTNAPDVCRLFMTLGATSRNVRANDDRISLEEIRAYTSICTLLKARTVRVKGIQLLLSCMLIARATSRQAMAVLNHAGVGMSYITTWDYLRQLTSEARYLESVRDGHWQWVYDNVNIRQAVRHEREDRHSSMLNITARLAVKIQNLPNWDFDWSDTRPQQSRQSLTISNFLPSEDDAQELKKRASHYMMEFLVTEFKSLADLRHLIPSQQPLHPVQKSVFVPMEVLFKDEKYRYETIDILTQLTADAQLSGDPQVVIGDQLTCKVIRGCKEWRQTELDAKDRLNWAHEVPGDFHFLWECLRVIFKIFWGSPSQAGSLCNLREYVRRLQVDKSVKVFNVGDEFLIHVFKAHLTASICTQLKLSNSNDSIDHEKSLQWLQQTAESLVEKNLMVHTTSADSVCKMHRALLHLGFLYLDLRNAIRWVNGPQIVRHWKFWLPRFIGTGCKNYATESINLVANLDTDFPRHLSYIATHNRTVNTEGKPGRGKPIDQLIEHYNLVMKQALRSSGANVTEQHVVDVSLSALFLMEAAKKADQAFGVTPQSTAHTTRNAKSDIDKIVNYLIQKDVTSEITGRLTPEFTDPTEQGWKKLGSTDWLQENLLKSHTDDLQLEDEMGEIDLDYELYDII